MKTTNYIFDLPRDMSPFEFSEKLANKMVDK
jgi:hypothetical protein